MTNKTYLGDSVYVEYDGQFVLTTENGYPEDPHDVIYLEPQVMANLMKYVQDLQAYDQRMQERNKQKKLFSGLDCSPGQQDLFPTDGAG